MNKWTVIFGILAILSIAFIFYNSMQSPAESEERSLAIVEQVKPFLDAEGRMTQKAFNDMIRTLAHLAEFAMLGFSMGGMLISVQGRGRERLIRNVLLMSAGVAIADEILQRFTGRYSDVKDVMLDVCGALIGVVIMKIAMKVMWHRK